MSKQTAVEWLEEQCPRIKTFVAYSVLEQAKEMEKQKMIEFAQSYAVIHCMGDITKNADEYYNETFNK